MKTQLTADVLRNPDQLCTAEHSPQALLPKEPLGLNPKAHRDPDRLRSAALEKDKYPTGFAKTLGSGLNAGNIGAD